MVLVRVFRKSHPRTGVIKGPESGYHLLPLVPPDRDGAIVAVKVPAGKVQIVLQLPEVRQNTRESPLGVAPFGPVVVVLGNTAEHDLSVDGAGAAGGPASGNNDRVRLKGGSGSLIVPAMRPVSRPPHVIAVLQVYWQLLEVGIVGPCLQQQYGLAVVLGKARCQDTARRTGPNDNVIVFHS